MGDSLQRIGEIETVQQQTQEFTCEICVEPATTTRKFRNRNLCTHQFCVDCVSKYIQVKILDNTAKIPCPGLNCEHNLDPVSNMSMISKRLFVKWCDLLCEDSVLDLEKCYCPNIKCTEMVVNECSGTVKRSKCPNCKHFFCFDCKNKWHANYSCQEFEAMTRDPDGVLLRNLIETKKWMRCPACGHCVELRNGCAYVKCRCNTKFCYYCGEKIILGHLSCSVYQGSVQTWEILCVLLILLLCASVIACVIASPFVLGVWLYRHFKRRHH